MNWAQRGMVALVRLYQWTLSPVKSALFGPLARCRFDPSCSEYAARAIARHGAVRGVGLALRRLLRCHPWGGCGYDPVPELDSKPEKARGQGEVRSLVRT